MKVEEEAVTEKEINELEIFVSQIFYNFFLFIYFFQLLKLITFFLYLFYPRHLPTPTTHDLYPLPTTHDPPHLATLVPRLIHHPKTLHLVLYNVWVRGMTYFAWLFKFMKSLQQNFHIVLGVFHHQSEILKDWLRLSLGMKRLNPTENFAKTISRFLIGCFDWIPRGANDLKCLSF